MALAVETATLVGSSGVAVAAPRDAPRHSAVVASATAPVRGPAQAQDEASALLMARLQKRRVEVLGARTDASQTFASANGSLTYETSVEPRWVRKGGAWAAVDASLRADGSGGYSTGGGGITAGAVRRRDRPGCRDECGR
jgi:hypothetical protein